MDVSAKNGLPLISDLDDLFQDYIEGLENLSSDLPFLESIGLDMDDTPRDGGMNGMPFPDFAAFDPSLAGVFSLDEFTNPPISPQKPAVVQQAKVPAVTTRAAAAPATAGPSRAVPAQTPAPAAAAALRRGSSSHPSDTATQKAKSSSPSGELDWTDDMDDTEDIGAGGRRSGRGGGHQNKSQKQQILNKQAQKRYRERKKEKAQQMETTIQILSQQLEEMKSVQKAHEALMQRNAFLERALKDREMEMLRMQINQAPAGDLLNNPPLGVNSLDAASPVPSSNPGLSGIMGATSSSELLANAGTPCGEGPDSAPNCKRLSMLFATQVEELGRFLEEKAIDPDHVDCSQSLECPVLCKELYQRIDLICQTCACVARAEGKDIEQLLGVNVLCPSQGSGTLSCKKNCPSKEQCTCSGFWTEIVKGLNLSREQVEACLHVRKIYFDKINKLFQDRQALNRQALQLLIPYAQENAALMEQVRAAEGAGGSEGGGPSASFVSLLMRSQQCADVSRTLDALKLNLREEQKITSEAEYLVCRRVLKPLQAAKVIKTAYPYFCDVFALLEATHLLVSGKAS